MMDGAIRHVNPAKLYPNPAFTRAIAVSGAVQTFYTGGQNAVRRMAALSAGTISPRRRIKSSRI